MCNLYANTSTQDLMRQLFSLPAERDRLGNASGWPAIFPKYPGPVLRLAEDGERELTLMGWGFAMPQTSRKTCKPIQPKAINNARDDKVRSSGFWRKSFEERRCLIPATSFCEAKGRGPAVYHWFGVDGRKPFCFAGIWRPEKIGYGKEDPPEATYSMLTSTPNRLVKPIHPDRMPVILDESDWETWLQGTPDEAAALMRPFPEDRMEIIAKGENLRSEPD
ncbi:hypothetical protein OCH239_09825 [Roseivivax halodurans JCM 10272]|uniref:Abasic site processing protein n=1 Tax=Roseivivax halodurans JCM 10272 TaxID=1449350 RepID=X7EEL8_9RHOB|nr:SOS response-associated peptidase [Roseivivax halodurans]ETX13568.1 hypothetical protein OCH239_09825 [Roseivivax halodurans JCM 10272]